MIPRAPFDRARVLATIVAHATAAVNQFCDALAQQPAPTLPELEAQALALAQACFTPLLQAAITAPQRALEAAPTCPAGHPTHYKATHARTLLTRLGPLTFRRAYHYCAQCHAGHYPLDCAWGLSRGQFSEGVVTGVCRLGACLPFAQAAATWTALTAQPISARQVARLTEARGQQLEAVRAAEQGQALAGTLPAAPVPAALRPRGAGIWAVALDAARVQFRDDWHEVKAGVVFWARRRAPGERAGHATAASYVHHVGGMEAAGERLYAEAVRRGLDPAEQRVVCLGDGAPSIWGQFATHFPQRVEILDWYHAVEHLWAAGQGLYGEGTELAAAWVGRRKAELWAGQVGAVVAALEQAGQGERGAAALKEMHYFQTNAGRMRYAAYRAAGYPIGSGIVESACKRGIGARAKGAGMRWQRAGLQGVLTLRAELLSGRWEVSWPAPRPREQAA